jgi:hypothetical protein
MPLATTRWRRRSAADDPFATDAIAGYDTVALGEWAPDLKWCNPPSLVLNRPASEGVELPPAWATK